MNWIKDKIKKFGDSLKNTPEKDLLKMSKKMQIG